MDSKNPTAGASTDNIIAHQARRWIKALERQFVITDDPQMPDEVREMAWNTACRCVVRLMESMPDGLMTWNIDDMGPFPLCAKSDSETLSDVEVGQ